MFDCHGWCSDNVEAKIIAMSSSVFVQDDPKSGARPVRYSVCAPHRPALGRIATDRRPDLLLELALCDIVADEFVVCGALVSSYSNSQTDLQQ